MQGTPPLGAAAVTPLLAHGHLGAAAAFMALLAGLPALAVFALRAGDRNDLGRQERGERVHAG